MHFLERTFLQTVVQPICSGFCAGLNLQRKQKCLLSLLQNTAVSEKPTGSMWIKFKHKMQNRDIVIEHDSEKSYVAIHKFELVLGKVGSGQGVN